LKIDRKEDEKPKRVGEWLTKETRREGAQRKDQTRQDEHDEEGEDEEDEKDEEDEEDDEGEDEEDEKDEEDDDASLPSFSSKPVVAGSLFSFVSDMF
jgi:hypothetical protein